MAYRYPINLYPLINKNWNLKRWSKEIVPSLPSENVVQKIIDVVYHASFLTEESRKLWFRVVYLKPEEIRKEDVIKFDLPRDFNVGELVKLAPAADPTQVLIGVYEKKGLNKLEIWGVVESGTSWWNFLRNESSIGSPPPNGFTVSSKNPGHINISRQGDVILSLNQGKLYEPSEKVFYQGPVSQFLGKASTLLHEEVCNKLNRNSYDGKGEDEDYPKRFYIYFLQRILDRIREKHHGGTLIIVPDHINKEDTRLKDRITIKYPCDYDEAWKCLVKDLAREKKYYDLYFKLGKQSDISKEEYEEVSSLSYDRESDEDIQNAVGFISSLTGVDGAVVLSDKLRLLGFGAEITAVSPHLKRVKISTDLEEGEEYKEIDLFGTRHRSALRFCSSFEDCVVFIVSQDGDVRVAKRVGSEVVLWSDVNVGSTGF